MDEWLKYKERKRRAEEKGKTLPEWNNEHNLIFTNETGGLLRRTNVAKRLFKRVNERAELEGVTPHTQAHTCIDFNISRCGPQDHLFQTGP